MLSCREALSPRSIHSPHSCLFWLIGTDWVPGSSGRPPQRPLRTHVLRISSVNRRPWEIRSFPGTVSTAMVVAELRSGHPHCGPRWGLAGAWANRTCVHAKSLQWCPNLCDPMDYSLPGSSVHGILQARILEWVAIPSSRASFWPTDQTCVFCGSWIAGEFFTAEPLGKPRQILAYHWSPAQGIHSSHLSSSFVILFPSPEGDPTVDT